VALIQGQRAATGSAQDGGSRRDARGRLVSDQERRLSPQGALLRAELRLEQVHPLKYLRQRNLERKIGRTDEKGSSASSAAQHPTHL